MDVLENEATAAQSALVALMELFVTSGNLTTGQADLILSASRESVEATGRLAFETGFLEGMAPSLN